MDIASLLERYGDRTLLALGGLVIGSLFGFFAQRSKFCLRAAVVEFWHRKFGEKSARRANWPHVAACRVRSSAGCFLGWA